MAKAADHFERVRDLFLALPDTEETFPWGSPHYRVKDKIFGGYGDEGEVPTIGFKLEKEHAAALVETDDRATPAKYVGKHGWITFELRGRLPWKRIESWIEESFRLIAPRQSRAKLD